MKKIVLTACLSIAAIIVFGQDNRPLNKSYNTTEKSSSEEGGGGFDWNRVFVGGNLSLGYTGGNTGSGLTLGISPEIGYSFSELIDAGINFNCIYNSYSFTDTYRYKVTAFNYGTGVFLRIHPIEGFFVQLQPEINWIAYTQKDQDNGFKLKNTVKATSFLAGIGYGQRVIGQTSFFTTLMIDLGSEKNSPYRDGYGGIIPIVRGGFTFYLGRGGKK